MTGSIVCSLGTATLCLLNGNTNNANKFRRFIITHHIDLYVWYGLLIPPLHVSSHCSHMYQIIQRYNGVNNLSKAVTRHYPIGRRTRDLTVAIPHPLRRWDWGRHNSRQNNHKTMKIDIQRHEKLWYCGA